MEQGLWGLSRWFLRGRFDGEAASRAAFVAQIGRFALTAVGKENAPQHHK